MTPVTNVGIYPKSRYLSMSMRGISDNERARTMIFGVVAIGHLFRRASATWLEARAALPQIAKAGKDKELSFPKVGMNGR